MTVHEHPCLRTVALVQAMVRHCTVQYSNKYSTVQYSTAKRLTKSFADGWLGVHDDMLGMESQDGISFSTSLLFVLQSWFAPSTEYSDICKLMYHLTP